MIESLYGKTERLHQRPSGFVYMMIKPLGLDPNVYEDIHTLIKRRGTVTVWDRLTVDRARIEEHYEGIKYLKDGSIAPHFHPITEYLVGQEVEALIVEDTMGGNADEFVTSMRELVGRSNPLDTVPGQIRNLALEHAVPYMRIHIPENDRENVYCRDNLVHCSDSLEAAVREINIWLPEIAGEHYTNQYEELRKT